VSVQEILYLRCILGHKIGGFRASEGLPNKHDNMLIMEIKFKQLLFTVQKRTIRCNLEIANFWIEDYKRLPTIC